MDVGVRVIRGPSWSWDDQDGGFVGTVVKPFESSLNVVQSGTVFVQWDNGLTGNYRVGRDGGYDLLILDSGPAGIQFPRICCDECGQKSLIGTRWKCAVCSNYDLCHACYHNDKHNLMHHFIRYESPSTTGIEVHSRTNSEKSEVHGIFPGATVVRRVEDWLHGQSDGGMGGMLGTVLEDPPSRLLNSNRGSIMVLWENGDTVEHICGNDGKVAVKCIIAAEGKEYYVQHLAELVGDQFIDRVQNSIREREEETQSLPLDAYGEIGPNDPGQSIDNGDESSLLVPFWPGDRVQVNVDVNVFRALQDDHHGGWDVDMDLCIGVTGVIVDASPTIVVVHYKSLKKRFNINPEALTKKLFAVGDRVRILTDEQRVKCFQEGHGGWVQKMREDLGKLAEVTGTGNDGRVLVKMEDRSKPYSWTLNENCCTLIESETGFQGSRDNDNDSDSEVPSMFMDALLSHHPELIQPEQLVQYSAGNIVPLVKAIVEKCPHLINMTHKDRTALHMSCLEGHVEVVRLLLNAGADITATDNAGNTPVHYSVDRKDDPSALEVILERGAACGDLINFDLISVLHLAAHRGHPRCVQMLIKHGCNVNAQDANGDTPLHDAITVGNRDSIEALANCRCFNFRLMNDQGLTVLQLAACKGDSFAVEQIVKEAQDLVNEQEEGRGFTALHIACRKGHRDVADILISKGNATMDVKNKDQCTPLMLTFCCAHVSTMELLIMKGANPNTCDGDGDAFLHWILKLIASFQMGMREAPTLDLCDAPEIASIVTQLPPGVRDPTWVGVALFLVQHGADIFQQNSSGTSPIQLLHDQKITDLLIKAQKRCQRRTNPPRKD